MLQVVRRPPHSSRWTEELAVEVEDLWRKNLSATEIRDDLAERNVHFSRNAVIGKLHRMGLTSEHGGSTQSQVPQLRRGLQGRSTRAKSGGELIRRVRSKSAGRGNAERMMLAAQQASFFCEGFRSLSVLELTEDTCRWPEGGEAGAHTINFCGQSIFDNTSYCAFHYTVSYGKSAA